jgi:hypothetical protein
MTKQASDVYGDVLNHIQKAGEANLKLQQDLFKQWTNLWPGFPSPKNEWLDKVREFQRDWADSVSKLAHKHREVLDKQYDATVESLEEALRLGDASNPEEFRQRTEQLCRKTLDCMREISKTQMEEFQEAVTNWSELATKAKPEA